jgi:hypothetical protein
LESENPLVAGDDWRGEDKGVDGGGGLGRALETVASVGAHENHRRRVRDLKRK